MNEIEALRRYGERTASTESMNTDVTGKVLATLRRTERAERADWSVAMMRPLASVAAATWVLAIVVGFYAQQSWAETQHPLTSLLTSFGVTLQ